MKLFNGLDLASRPIANLADPTGAQDAATKAYVDGKEFATRTYIDATTTSATAQNTGLSFTPGTDLAYEFSANLLVTSSNNTANFAVGIAWPSGVVFGQAVIESTHGLTLNSGSPATNANSQFEVNNAAAFLSNGLQVGTNVRLISVRGTLLTGATVSGSLRLQFANTNGQTSTIKGGSFLRVRPIV